MKDFALDAVLFILASPILLIRGLFRFRRQIRYWMVAYSPTLTCRTCRSPISLVGMWRCGCGYQSPGHVLRYCPNCRSIPSIIRCYECGCTAELPEPV